MFVNLLKRKTCSGYRVPSAKTSTLNTSIKQSVGKISNKRNNGVFQNVVNLLRPQRFAVRTSNYAEQAKRMKKRCSFVFDRKKENKIGKCFIL